MKSPHLEMLQDQLTGLCRTLPMPKNRVRWFWGLLTLGLLCFVVGLLVKDFPMLVQQFQDHWMPQ